MASCLLDALPLTSVPMPDVFSLSDQERARLLDLVLRKSGIRIQKEQRSLLEWAVEHRLRAGGDPSAQAYIRRLEEDRDEFFHLVDLLSVRETYFFRYQGQFDALAKLLPSFEAKPHIRLWSAGCATGEEPYTIALVAARVLRNPAKLHAMASDISRDALERAKRGLYSQRAVRLVPAELLSAYFERFEDQYRVGRAVRDRVHFFHHNLLQDPFPQDLDIIFCRNVTIYFERQVTERIIRKFMESLAEGGYLFLGHAESLHGMNLGLEVCSFENAFCYQKLPRRSLPSSGAAKRAQPASPPSPPAAPFVPAPVARTPALPRRVDVSELPRLLHNGEYRRIVEQFGHLREDDVADRRTYYRAVGQALAHLDRIAEGTAMLEKAVKEDPLDVTSHYFLGILYWKGDDLDRATQAFRKVLYLDPKHAPAFFHLACIHERQGEMEKARRHYQNALVSYWDQQDAGWRSDTDGRFEEVCLNKVNQLRRPKR